MSAEDDPTEPWLDSVEGEIAFFRSVMRARPVGIHRHFHVLAIRNAIHHDTGQLVPMEDIWRKLGECYDLDMLESLEMDGFAPPGEKKAPTPLLPFSAPSPSENLVVHPYFRAEYALPDDPGIDALISRRRMRASASVASSSPAPSPAHEKPAMSSTRGSKRKKSQLKKMAGLVAGDSDSSALTQESGDESQAPTPTSNPDAGTEYAEGDNEHEPSPESAAPSKRKGPKGRRNSTATRGKSSTSTRGVKKRKR